MKNFIQVIEDKLNNLIWTLIICGTLLVILAVGIAWSSLVLQLLVALAIMVMAYSLFYAAYKIHSIKKLIQ